MKIKESVHIRRQETYKKVLELSLCIAESKTAQERKKKKLNEKQNPKIFQTHNDVTMLHTAEQRVLVVKFLE